MSNGWRDFEEGRPGITLSRLSDGESVDLFVDEPPYLNTEEIEQEDGSVETSESLRVPVIPVSVPDGFTDMSGETVETVEEPHEAGDDAPRYHVINSSTAFKRAMREAFPEGVNPVASVITVTANQPEGTDTFGRTYSVDY